jgi:hypothetical protein
MRSGRVSGDCCEASREHTRKAHCSDHRACVVRTPRQPSCVMRGLHRARCRLGRRLGRVPKRFGPAGDDVSFLGRGRKHGICVLELLVDTSGRRRGRRGWEGRQMTEIDEHSGQDRGS